jgi:hypothetical protein
MRHDMDDGTQIEICGDVIGEVLDDDDEEDEDGPVMETAGAESMPLSE